VTWEKKRILVTAKAAPESSTRHGDSVCTAGITDDGEFIRLYPITLGLFQRGKGPRKFDWIEVECQKSDEMLGRKESYKVRENTIRIIDRGLNQPKKGHVDWAARNEILMPLKANSIEDLERAFGEDHTSLGFVKVGELQDFYKTQDLREEEQVIHKVMQSILDVEYGTERLTALETLNQIPHIFRYKFTCQGSACHRHDMTCEDWELFQSCRQWPKRYGDQTWEMLKDKFYTKMKQSDLHFFMGTESRYGRWLIIGLYYPPIVS
jgi:hypothetical protein